MKAGIKVFSTNHELFSEADKLYEEGKICYLEVYVVPGSYKYSIGKLRKLNVPIVLHCTHSGHGFNLGNKNKIKENKKIFDEVLAFASEIDTKDIVVHPGFGEIDDSISTIKNLGCNNYIIENMPRWGESKEDMIGYSKDKLKQYVDIGMRFCLDLAHAYKAAISLGRDPKKFILDLIDLKPCMFHISDGHLKWGKDEHLSLGEGEFDLKFLKGLIGDARVSFETPKKEGLKEDIKNIEYFEKI